MTALFPYFVRLRLEAALTAFFAAVGLSALVVYIADPAIYAQSLALTSTPTDRYPPLVTVSLVGVCILIGLLVVGITRHWRWLFWLILLAFCGSILRFPVTLMQFAGLAPAMGPRWYAWFQLGVTLIELTLAIWMIVAYRRAGVWGRGKSNLPISHT